MGWSQVWGRQGEGDTCVCGGREVRGTRTKNWDKVTNLEKEVGKVPPPSADRGPAWGGQHRD